jgi:hypothetical protein
MHHILCGSVGRNKKCVHNLDENHLKIGILEVKEEGGRLILKYILNKCFFENVNWLCQEEYWPAGFCYQTFLSK